MVERTAPARVSRPTSRPSASTMVTGSMNSSVTPASYAVRTAATGSDAGGAEAGTVEVEDNNGPQTVQTPPASVVATDNRTFETLSDWDVELSAGAVSLMPDDNPYTEDEDIVDLGNHREPNLEAVVAAEPTLIINGQRFAQYHDDFVKYAPEATILELDPRDDQPFADLIAREAKAAGVPIALAHAVVFIESSYRPNVTGRAGEVGLMQIKPATARDMGFRGSTRDLYDPATNLRYGMKYLAGAKARGGGTTCGTILKYNAGHYATRSNPVSRRYCERVKVHMASF